MSDEELSKSFHQKFYSDMDYKEFSNKFIGESKSIELFPTFDKPPAEIPTTGAGFVGDVAGGLLETPATIAGGIIGPIGGGINALGHGIAAAAAGVPVKEAVEEAFHHGTDRTRTFLGLKPETYAGQQGEKVFSDLFDMAVKGVGSAYENTKRAFDLDALEKLKYTNPEKYKALYEKVHAKSGEARRLIEGGIEGSAYITGTRGVGKSLKRNIDLAKEYHASRKDTGIKELPPDEVKPSPTFDPTEQAHRELDSGVRAPQYGRGQVPDYIERDMFGQPEIRPEPIERVAPGAEVIPQEFLQAREVPQLTPEQLKAAQEGRPYVPYETSDPRMGLEATTSRGASPRPLEEVPGVSFEPNRPFVGREEFAGTTGWQEANPRVAEAIAGDSYLKGMSNRLAKMEENLRGIEEMRGEVSQRLAQRRIGEGGTGSLLGREAVAYTRSAEAVRRDIADLKEKIDKRVQMHEERVRAEPKFEKTTDGISFKGMRRRPVNTNIQKTVPFELGKGPGRRQGGAINPEVFREGFQKIKEVAGKGIRLIAYAPRIGDVPVFRISARNDRGIEIGFANFITTRGGLKDISERDLISALTGVKDGHRRQGVATEIYKFAHELGNDIVPSHTQTLQGKAMWEGFKAKGVPLKQRGAVNFGVSEKVAKMVDKLRSKNDSNSPSNQVGDIKTTRDAIMASGKGEVRLPEVALTEIGKENIKELPNSSFNKIGRWWSNAQMLYNETGNPWVKYIADFTASAKQEGVLLHDVLTRGITFGKGLFPRKIIAKDSPAGIWESLSHFDRRIVSDIINKYNGVMWPTRDQIIAMGGKEKHAKILEKLQEPLQNMWERVNEIRVENGKAPLPWKPFYFMKATGFGPHLVRVVDKATGESIAFSRAQTRFGAKQLEAELKKVSEFDPETMEVRHDIANQASKGNKYNISTTLLEEIMHALETKDPRRKAINSAIADIRSKGGFGAHGARRMDVKGMDLTPKNFWETYDSYIKDGANYISNQKLGKAIEQLKLMKEIPPDLRNWSIEHMNLNRGGRTDTLMADIEGHIDSLFGSGNVRKALSYTGRGFATARLLAWRATFLIPNAVQATAFMPKVLADMKYERGYSQGSAVMSAVEGSLGMFSPNKELKATYNFLAARGKLDPGLVSEISLFNKNKVGDFLSGSWVARKVEMINRMQAASVGYNFFKKQGLVGKDLNLAIERFTDDVMGNYSMTDRPGYIQRTGIVGEAMKPLSTFQNYFWGTTILTLKHAIEGAATGNFKRAIPFMNHWLSMAAWGGVMAAPFMAEIDNITSFLKSWGPWQALWKATTGEVINEATPGLSERLLTSQTLPDSAKLGWMTGATQLLDPRGVHISGGMSSPEMRPSFMTHGWKGIAPGIGWGYEALSGLITILGANLGADYTVEEKRKAWQNISIGDINKIIANMDSSFEMEAGLPFRGEFGFGNEPVPAGKRGYGSVRRDDFEKWASIIGSGTIPEVKEKAALRDLKEGNLDITAQKGRLVDLGLDALKTGDDEKLTRIMEKYLQLGFTDYADALKTAMVKRHLTEQERIQKAGARNPDQIRRLKFLEEAVGNH